MELRDYLHVLRKHAMMITLLSLASTIGAIGYTLMLLTDQYKATALVLVTPQDAINLSSTKSDKEILSFPLSGQAKVETPSNTYIELITARATAEKVVRMLNLDRAAVKPPATTLYEQLKDFLKETYDDVMIATIQILKYGRILPPLPPLEKAIERFQKNISLKAVKDTYVFEISYTSPDPAQASDVANAAATVFVDEMIANRAKTAKGFSGFVAERLVRADRELAEARVNLRNFQVTHGITSLQDETTEKIKAISELEVALVKAEVRVDGLLRTLAPENPKVLMAEAERQRLASAISRSRTELASVPERQKQSAMLNLEVLAAEDIYQLVKKEHEEAKIREGMNVGEMMLAAPAFPPVYPTKPIKVYYVAGALATALLLGIGLAFLLEYFDTKIRTVEHAERTLQLRVLATLPVAKLGG